MTQRLSCGNQVEQFAIFYGGRIWVCDATELQARAIIWMARRELEERMKKSTSQWSKAVSTTVQTRLHCPPGVSMKKSLKHFLERRKRRIQASSSSPYQR